MFKDKFKAFIIKWNNKWIDYDGVYFNQCKDFTNQYTKEIFGFESPKGNAYPVYFKNWNGWTKYRNTPDFLPKPGDICIWKIGSYGHIGVVVKATLDNLIIIDQNTGNGTGKKNNINNRIRIHKYNYNNVYGFIRHNSLINTFVTKLIKEEVKPLISNSSNIIWGEDTTVRGFTFPRSINGVRVTLGRTSQKGLYGMSLIKGYTPFARYDHIEIYEPFFKKYKNDKQRLLKLLMHEFFHQIQHKYYTKEEEIIQEGMFNRNNDKGFVSKYSKSNHWEYGAETFAYGIIYLGEGLPENKQWNGGIGADFSYLYKRYKKYIKNFN